MTRSTKIPIFRGGFDAFYPAVLPLSRQTLTCTAGGHPPPLQADRIALAQAQPLPAGPAGPGLPAQKGETLAGPGRPGRAYVVIDGTVIRIGRVIAGRPFLLRQALPA